MEGAATQDDNNVTMKEGSVGVGRHTRTYHQNPHTSRTFHSNLTTLGLFNDVAIQLASLPLGTTHINPSNRLIDWNELHTGKTLDIRSTLKHRWKRTAMEMFMELLREFIRYREDSWHANASRSCSSVQQSTI